MKITEHLTLEECISSQTATRLKIDNKPTEAVVENLRAVGENVFEKVRAHFGTPIRLSSGYRSPKLNKAIGGSKTSQHMTGQALDIQGTNGVSNKAIFDYIKANLVFDQLIWEFGNAQNPAWVHVSYRADGKNRKQVLTIK